MKDTLMYDHTISKLRKFFKEIKGFTEVPTQSRLSIMSACEDPSTISTFKIGGVKYPLIQSSQMQLEYELLTKPDLKGVFCLTTSYRDEKSPIKGRHDLVFPLIEAESHGGMEEMKKIQTEMLIYMGFDEPYELQYEDACEYYGVSILESEQEEAMAKDYSQCISLQMFPERANPFFNMNYSHDDLYEKIDLILAGQEATGSASRSCDPDLMMDKFISISDGQYAQTLFDHFTKKRVMDELESYLKLSFFPRYGMGVGVTRLCRALKLLGI